MSETCKCGAAQSGSACACGILERGVWSHDFRDEAQLMSADNARLCNIVEAADILLRAAQLALSMVSAPATRARLRKSIEHYKVVRQGQ